MDNGKMAQIVRAYDMGAITLDEAHSQVLAELQDMTTHDLFLLVDPIKPSY